MPGRYPGRDAHAAGSAAVDLGELPGLGDGALLLGSSFSRPSADHRPEAIAALAPAARSRRDPSCAALTSAARALEQGER